MKLSDGLRCRHKVIGSTKMFIDRIRCEIFSVEKIKTSGDNVMVWRISYFK